MTRGRALARTSLESSPVPPATSVDSAVVVLTDRKDIRRLGREFVTEP
jgi:hypothetical protein